MDGAKLAAGVEVSGMGIGPRDVQAAASAGPGNAGRDTRIRGMFLEAHAAEIVGAIETGKLGKEMRRQWRRWRTNSEKFWPFTERRKART